MGKYEFAGGIVCAELILITTISGETSKHVRLSVTA